MCYCSPDKPFKVYVRPTQQPVEAPPREPKREAPPPEEEQGIPVDWPVPAEAPAEK